ncbi:MAG TPA: amidase [Acidimicrobiia bacterium]|jgi:aspartyl-tRNA(Asn)/glutamyl-tRNA(Gln) amidotransferase subunit A
MVAGSIADDSFVAAQALLAARQLDDARRRVPFDYDGGHARSVAPWAPPRALLPAEARGPLVDAMRALRRREVSASDLVAAARGADRPELGGVVEWCTDAERHAASLDAELAAGRDRGPLHGIPITVKDVIDVAGVTTRAGSAVYHDVPEQDAAGVARLEASGAIVVAKAETHEFALGVTSPQCRNPHDPSRLAGGSSGGSAICVTIGVGLGSLGTDTRASIRVPAALTGTVGLKPTYGRVPTEGVVSLSWTMDHVAPLASTVTDAALMLDALIGGDSHLAWTPTESLAGLRVGVPSAAFAGAEPGVVVATQVALDTLTQIGACVARAEHPTADDFDLANAAGLVISRCEAAAAHRTLGLDTSGYWEEVREQLRSATSIAAVDYLDAQRLRSELRLRLLSAFDDADVLVMPTVPVVAPPVEEFAGYLMLLARNAIPWSLVGFPAMSIPAGTSEGLPVGLQLVAPPGEERRLVQVGRAIEHALA